MVRVLESNNEFVTVEVKRTIRVGITMKINPSEAYLGIQSGNIKVLAIGTPAELVDLDGYMYRSVTSDVDEFARIHLESTNAVCSYEEYSAEQSRLVEQPWVVYRYNGTGEVAVLPLEEFVDHAMHY